jgi:hypothetical protein
VEGNILTAMKWSEINYIKFKRHSSFIVRVLFACIESRPTSDSNKAVANVRIKNCENAGTSGICGR